jgi:branched-chain amino acid transport system permease protein
VNLFLQNAINAMSLGGLYSLVALGVALIFGVMGFINFAHGELLMIGGYVLIYVAPTNWLEAVPATVAVVVVAALLMERIAFRPVRGASPTTLLITSFAVSYFLQNLALLTVGTLPRSVNFPPSVSMSIAVGGLSIPRLAIADIVTALVLLTALGALLKWTLIGTQMRAAAQDFEMARLLGVRANRVIAFAFALSGLLAAAVSLLFVAQVGIVTPTMGVAPALVGFVATVLGGMRSLVGAAIGGFLLGVATIVAESELPPNLSSYRDAFVFGAVILVLLVRPQGLLGTAGPRERV